jgi:hypothetical protein
MVWSGPAFTVGAALLAFTTVTVTESVAPAAPSFAVSAST